MSKTARITGQVEYREGDGPGLPIRPGLVEYEESDEDVTVSWEDGDYRGSAAMPRSEWQRFLSSRDIELLD
ncbi:hypothetical protein [Azohydromonas caseinilytica]|uniref:DUF4314 domain-containing protein n=1 Tax=Azohydromonas caseinilytica TaxID=2728836 RepID=A0A848FC36_9BURK|nr:hypothetical protein [Azohydromonas caseinilytica]NML15873.1 hypothetical protein [Azohydromonas caseinilytica]